MIKMSAIAGCISRQWLDFIESLSMIYNALTLKESRKRDLEYWSLENNLTRYERRLGQSGMGYEQTEGEDHE